MQKITPFLWFDDQAEQAMRFYVSIFKSSKVLEVTPGPDGKTMGVRFELEGQEFVRLNAGPEFKLTANNSLGLQFDGNTTPYQPTGSAAFDESYGSLTIGLSHRIRTTRTPLLVQAYARENLNLPFRVRWNTDPDFAIGLKITAQFRNAHGIR